MDQVIFNSAASGIVLSLLAFEIGTWIRKKWKLAILNPLLISILIVIGFLVCFRIDYESYNSSAKYISYFLTPSTVSLAIPLYQQMALLREHKAALAAGLGAGVLTSLSSVFLLSAFFGLSHEQYVTLLPKSITTAIGMGISEELGGIVTITVAAIILTGIIGSMIAEGVCAVFRITDPMAKGLAIGAASHAIGTTKAMELGEIEGAMSSLAIAVSGLLTVIGASVFANLM